MGMLDKFFVYAQKNSHIHSTLHKLFVKPCKVPAWYLTCLAVMTFGGSAMKYFLAKEIKGKKIVVQYEPKEVKKMKRWKAIVIKKHLNGNNFHCISILPMKDLSASKCCFYQNMCQHLCQHCWMQMWDSRSSFRVLASVKNSAVDTTIPNWLMVKFLF